jgi:hypothetical protein
MRTLGSVKFEANSKTTDIPLLKNDARLDFFRYVDSARRSNRESQKTHSTFLPSLRTTADSGELMRGYSATANLL